MSKYSEGIYASDLVKLPCFDVPVQIRRQTDDGRMVATGNFTAGEPPPFRSLFLFARSMTFPLIAVKEAPVPAQRNSDGQPPSLLNRTSATHRSWSIRSEPISPFVLSSPTTGPITPPAKSAQRPQSPSVLLQPKIAPRLPIALSAGVGGSGAAAVAASATSAATYTHPHRGRPSFIGIHCTPSSLTALSILPLLLAS